MRPRRRVWLMLCLLLGGCAAGVSVVADPDYRVERGRSLVVVVESPREAELEAVSRQVRGLLTAELSRRWLNVLDRDVLVQTSPDLGPTLAQAARQLQIGGRVPPAVAERLLADHGVGQLLLVDVLRYDQSWGHETRITRIGVEARLVHMVDNRTLWQGRYEVGVSDAPGSGYEAAPRRAAGEMARLLSDEQSPTRDSPMWSWYVLEYFRPN